MLKKIFLLLVLLFAISWELDFQTFAQPDINCNGLPGCENGTDAVNASEGFIVGLITEFIKYIAVIAVISIMLGGFLYLVSGGEEEKVNKAKKWIIWSLAGVFISIMAWGIIEFINNLTITNI